MGSHPYWYVEPFKGNVGEALDQLRDREFRAGRYNPVIPFPDSLFPIREDAPAPGAKHSTISEALESSGTDGTRSILDISRLSTTPRSGAACPFSEADLEAIYGSRSVELRVLLENDEFFDVIERGEARYHVGLGRDGEELILFAGMSYD